MKHPAREFEALEARIAPATLVGVDHSNNANHLLSFDSASPTSVTTTPVTGVATGETLIGIDVRPATGALYGVGVDATGEGHVYAIDPTTGVATMTALLTADPADSTSPFTSVAGANFGVDFNPVTDRLRIVSDTNQNLRVNVDNGNVTTDDDLNPSGSAVASAAYTNSFAGATGTVLYDIDVTNDVLVRQNPPNNGTISTVGAGLGFDVTGTGGFDILSTRAADGSVTETGFAALTVGGVTGLYSIDLANGTATPIANIGSGAMPLNGLTALIGGPAPKAFTIDAATNHLLAFNTATPNLTTDIGAVSGITSGESIVGFDFSPTTGALIAVTKDGSAVGHLYSIDPATGVATSLGALSAEPTDTTTPYTTLTGTHFGVDFNPTNGKLRIVSDSGQNLRVDVAALRVTTDPALTDASNAATTATGAAYTNNFSGATSTTLYDINTDTDKLVTQDLTTGVTTVVGAGLGVDASAVNGFDIHANGDAYASLTVSGATHLYKINLQTGAATLVGDIGAGTSDTLGLALAPVGTIAVDHSSVLVKEGAGFASITLQRTHGSAGATSVLVQTADAGATAGSDYTAFSQVVTFADGETSKTIQVPITNDTVREGNESFTVNVTPVAGDAVLGAAKTTVTIADDDTNLIALGANSHLLAFNAAAPATVVSDTPVMGLGTGETLVGIDYRPATGGLYGVSMGANGAGHLYLINAATGAATLVANLTADSTDTTSPYTSLSGANFALDFNPSGDALRVLSDTGQNLRIDVTTGKVITDTAFDPANGIRAGAAYSNAFAGATGTVLYDIDVTNDQLVIQDPVAGTVSVVGALGVDAAGASGFDIVTARAADGSTVQFGYATLTVGATTSLYSIDLATGAATSLGMVGDGSHALSGLTSPIAAASAKAFTIDDSNHLLSFDTATPNLTTTVATISNIGAGETIVGFDFRPSNGQLYVLTKNASNAGRLYTVNTTTGAATSVGTLTSDATDTTNTYTALNGASFGVDFDPASGKLRVVSDTGQNLRVDLTTLGVVTDPALNGTGVTGATAAAYDHNANGASMSTLYEIDSATDTLYKQTNATDGALTSIGSLGVDASAIGGFDIRANGEAYATMTVGGVSGLYSIDLATGHASLVGSVGADAAGTHTLGLALAPAGTFQFSAITPSVGETAGSITLTINRVGGSDGAATVLVKSSDLTATAGADYTAISQAVSFAAGETSKTIQVPILDDNIYEGSETFKVTLSDVTGGAGINDASGVATVTIADSETKPTLSINDVKQAEGNADGTMTFTVTLSGASATDTTFHFATAAGSAIEGSTTIDTPGADYLAKSGDITIPAGQTSATIAITTKGDRIEEGNETFTVTLSSVVGNATLGDAVGLGTLVNDDGTQSGPRTLSWLDVDGDRVTMKLSGSGALDANTDYTFLPAGTLGGVQLVELDLSKTHLVSGQTVADFAHDNVTFSAVRSNKGGDGFVNVGYIDATGVALGAVSLKGDLGKVDAASLSSLSVGSLGKLGTSTQSAGGSLISTISGSLPTLVVRTQIVDAHLIVAGNLGTATIGGIDGGEIHVGGGITTLNILNSLEGATVSAKTATTVKVRGDVEDSNFYLIGSTAPTPAQRIVLKTLNIGGSVNSSNILAGYTAAGGEGNADVAIGTVVVGGDWHASNLSAGVRAGNDGFFGTSDDVVISGGVSSTVATIASITIKGQISGTPGTSTDAFGIVAEQIGLFTNGVTKFPFVTATKDDFAVGATGDVHVREAAQV